MARILSSLNIRFHAGPRRRPPPGRLGAPSSAPVPRALPSSAVDPSYDECDDEEECGIDFITMEPIRGADCRRLRAEEAQVAARAAAVAAANAARTPAVQLSSTDEDGYDFFKGTLDLSASRGHAEEQEKKETPPAPLSLRGHAVEPLEDVRPMYRASPLQEEFRRQKDKSTAAKILFLDDGGEFRAPLAAALLRHMLARLRVKLDVVVDCASLGPAGGFPSRGGPSPELARTAAAMGVPLGTASTPRRFQEVADSVRYDLILVFDRFDRQEVLREVAILDALNPGGNYSGRVRMLGPFGMAARRASPPKVATDIADPLYDAPSEEGARRAALEAAAAQLAFACRGLATYLLDLKARCGKSRELTLRDALGLSLLCPLLAGELPSHRDRAALDAFSKPSAGKLSGTTTMGDARYTVRAVNGRRRVVRRRAKPRGYWRDPANVDAELRGWMAAHDTNRLPTQRELRASGASSLGTAVDAQGGMAAAAARLGVAMAVRQPNGYWDDFKNLEHALREFLRPEGPSNELLMPSVRMLVDAGRGDIVRALHANGGMLEVAERLGVGVRRGGGWDEASVLAELRAAAAAGAGGALGGALPTRDQLVAVGRGDLAAAVLKLGGFGYFRELDLSMRSTHSWQGCSAVGAAEDHGLGSFGTVPRRLPMIDEVGAEVQGWLQGAGKGVAAPGVLPTRNEMEAAGRGDLWVSVQRIGGGKRLAEHLGLGWVETRGRRRKSGGGGSSSDSSTADPREEIYILDAYEEFTFV